MFGFDAFVHADVSSCKAARTIFPLGQSTAYAFAGLSDRDDAFMAVM
jgi:hypothetical protein